MVDVGTVIALIKALGSGGGGGGGTTDYDDLTDKPQINGVTLSGDKIGAALGLADLDAIAPDYSDLTFPISAGQLCIHDGGLYEANDDISTNEEWTAGHWTNVILSEVLSELILNAPKIISGSNPSITAKPGVRYVCGECSTLTIVVPTSGVIDVVFESGSTATILTVTPPAGQTMKWTNEFDPTNLDSNTIYEINIMDGCYGVVGEWT